MFYFEGLLPGQKEWEKGKWERKHRNTMKDAKDKEKV